eukprot:309173_1
MTASYFEPIQWIPLSVLGLLVMIINIIILQHEVFAVWKAGLAIFTTKYLKIWSFLCMCCPPIIGLTVFLQHFNGFCYFMWYISAITIYIQPLFVGFYQLSRLYYCFAKSQVHSDHGYSRNLFIVMYSIGIIWFFSVVITASFSGALPGICGINEKYEYYVQYIDIGSPSVWRIGVVPLLLVYICWDAMTLLLYVLKIKSFKKIFGNKNHKANANIYRRILCIMHRVLILTLFYEIFTLLVTLGLSFIYIFILSTGSGWLELIFYGDCLLSGMVYSYSVYLMLEHHTSQYVKFLKFLCYFKLHYIFCCKYRYIVVEQLNEMDVEQTEIINAVKESDKQRNDSKTKTYETHDISKNHGEIVVNQHELSIPTTMTE